MLRRGKLDGNRGKMISKRTGTKSGTKIAQQGVAESQKFPPKLD